VGRGHEGAEFGQAAAEGEPCDSLRRGRGGQVYGERHGRGRAVGAEPGEPDGLSGSVARPVKAIVLSVTRELDGAALIFADDTFSTGPGGTACLCRGPRSMDSHRRPSPLNALSPTTKSLATNFSNFEEAQPSLHEIVVARDRARCEEIGCSTVEAGDPSARLPHDEECGSVVPGS